MIINNLIFSSGGLRGIAFIGAYKYLYKKKLLNNLKILSGCSAGSIMALLVNIGYDPDKLSKFIIDTNFEDLKDFNYINFIESYGIETGDKLMNHIKILLKDLNYEENITFKQLYELTNIKLFINTICINDYKVIYNSVDNSPDMEILLAIRMSISIPFIFKPVLYNEKYYVDGGLIDYVPIEMCNGNKDNTLIIELANFKLNNSISNFYDYAYHILSCMFYHLNIKTINYSNYNYIRIDTDEFNNLLIELNKGDKIKLINYGFKFMREFYITNIKTTVAVSNEECVPN